MRVSGAFGALTALVFSLIAAGACGGEEFTSVSTGGSSSGGGSGGSPPADAGCDLGQKSCNGQCVDANDPAFGCDPASCAPCALAHAQSQCKSGACAVFKCDNGFADCDGAPASGCEADLNTKETCGACGTACPGAQLCNGGQCGSSCTPPQENCSGTCVNTQTNPGHCGGCGTACPAPLNANPACNAGNCGYTCSSGFGDCDKQAGNGCEANLGAPKTCGACDVACPAAPVGAQAVGCLGGKCKCSAGRVLCSLADSQSACVLAAADPFFCGTSCTTCNAGESCANGTCTEPTCAYGLSCGPSCANLRNDPLNCGSCGKVCPAGQKCSGNACVGSCSGLTDCSNACADLTLDPTNCGACGVKCDAGEVCLASSCQKVQFAAEGWECTVAGKTAHGSPASWAPSAAYYCK